jgi:N-terminal acetyltransferase B complex catalytic subunit
MQYLAHWPEYFQVAESPSGEIMGYSKFFVSINLWDCLSVGNESLPKH